MNWDHEPTTGAEAIARIRATARRLREQHKPKPTPPAPAKQFAMPKPPPWPIVAEDAILRIVSERRNIPIAVLMSRTQEKLICDARHVVMYLANDVAKRSFPQIGRQLGRDHTTIMHGVQKVRRMLRDDPRLSDEIHELEKQFHQIWDTRWDRWWGNGVRAR